MDNNIIENTSRDVVVSNKSGISDEIMDIAACGNTLAAVTQKQLYLFDVRHPDKMITSYKASDGLFDGSCSICVDQEGYVFIAEKRGHRITVVDRKGQYVDTIQLKDKKTKKHSLVNPNDIAMVRDGKLVIRAEKGHSDFSNVIVTFEYK